MSTTQKQFPIRILSWLVMVAGFGPVLCAAEPALAATTNAFDKITYQDSGGFTGRGTGKAMILTGDGKLEAKGRTGPAKTVQLDQKELAEIHQAVAAVEWATVQKQYTSRGADLIMNSLTIVIAGKTYQTRADQLAKLPPELKKLFTLLDAAHRRATAAPKL